MRKGLLAVLDEKGVIEGSGGYLEDQLVSVISRRVISRLVIPRPMISMEATKN